MCSSRVTAAFSEHPISLALQFSAPKSWLNSAPVVCKSQSGAMQGCDDGGVMQGCDDGGVMQGCDDGGVMQGCDDGGSENGDGCAADCTIETGKQAPSSVSCLRVLSSNYSVASILTV